MITKDAPPANDRQQSAANDAELAAVLDAYLAALEAGHAPDPEALLAEHARIADRLRACLAGLRLVKGGAEGLEGKGRAEEPAEVSAGTPLGDFRLLREVGRGGMGVVYEAEQLSLGRRVALKVLPFAGALDARQLQRFKNEAQAAAHLLHQNIVPVYFVGCDRGVHYYAMQYIDGCTLAAMIAELRRERGAGRRPEPDATTPYTPEPPGPASAEGNSTADAAARVTSVERTSRGETVTRSGTPGSGVSRAAYGRWVARLGEQAALALEHAHQLGVVHRDIKPGNLLLDSRGNLWVTDFGLAHCQSHAGLTMSGDLVGTLRYMSPEQALAKRVVVDHRTDVYSLGITLYELLVLEPAYPGKDREELLRQIAFEEPRRPRRLDKAIAPELETIVLKALAKNPDERYQTAQDLADDLRYYLEDKPIRARRPGPVKRARKWCRRHRAVVSSVLAVLVIAGLLVAGSALWWFEKRARLEAEVEPVLTESHSLHSQGKLLEALSAARRADGLLAGGPVHEELAERVHEWRAEMQMASRLEDIRARARVVVKDGVFDFAGTDRAFGEAFRDYGIEVEELPVAEAAGWIAARPIRVELAAALDDWAMTRATQGRPWRDLLAVAAAADRDAVREPLRAAWTRQDGAALVKLAAAVPVEELPAPTVESLAGMLGELGAVPEAVALLERAQAAHPGDFWINYELSLACHKMRPRLREEAIRFATAALAVRPDNVAALNNLGNALFQKGRLDEALTQFRAASRCKKDFPVAHFNLGTALSLKGHLDEAIAEHGEAIRLKNDFAEAHDGLGSVLRKKGRLDEAIAEHREAIRLQKDFAQAHYNLGNVLRDKGQLDEAIAEYLEAIRLKKDDDNAYTELGALLLDDMRDFDGAIIEFQTAIRLDKDNARAHCGLGIALMAKGELEDAIAEYREAIRLKKDYAEAHYSLGNALRGMDRLDEAIGEWRAAIRVKKDLAGAHTNLGLALAVKGQFRDAVKEVRLVLEIGSLGPDGAYQAAHNLRQVQRLADLDARLPALLAGKEQAKDATDRLALAWLCNLRQQRYAAVRWYNEALN
jgi:serine/threonine protein kinase/Flp pilus assembly protein TadD